MNKSPIIAAFAIIMLSALLALIVYPNMPDSMDSHWNFDNKVDGHMTKFWGLFLMPIVSLGMFLLFLALPLIDPLKKNIEKFRFYYNQFILVMITFMFYMNMVIMLWNFGFKFNMSSTLLPGIGAIMYFAGVLMKHAEQNWFIGIRTPWTLSNKKVWDKTHKLGSIIFRIVGVIILLSVFISEYERYIIFASILALLYPMIYSYLEFKKIETKPVEKRTTKTVKKTSRKKTSKRKK